MELSFKDLKMQKWDVPTDRDKKNEVTFLVIMFTQEDLSAVLKCFAQAATNLLLSSENTKKSHVLNFNNQTLEGNMIFTIFKHFYLIFLSTLWALSVGLSHLCIPRSSKFHFSGPPFPLFSGL